MELQQAIDFARQHRNAVLTTQKRDGRPQLSNILYVLGDDDTFLISITAPRAKYRNIQRDPRVSIHITQDDFYAYAVIEGDAQLSPVAADPHDATVDALVAHYRGFGGEHPNWDEFRTSMVTDQRVLVTVRPTHAYGML
jgi:PPOX class probable F420-dependent enzyme